MVELVMSTLPRGLGRPRARAGRSSGSWAYRRGRATAAGTYWPPLPRTVSGPVLCWRLSFPLTAAGQLRIRTGFPLATPARGGRTSARPGSSPPPTLSTTPTPAARRVGREAAAPSAVLPRRGGAVHSADDQRRALQPPRPTRQGAAPRRAAQPGRDRGRGPGGLLRAGPGGAAGRDRAPRRGRHRHPLPALPHAGRPDRRGAGRQAAGARGRGRTGPADRRPRGRLRLLPGADLPARGERPRRRRRDVDAVPARHRGGDRQGAPVRAGQGAGPARPGQWPAPRRPHPGGPGLPELVERQDRRGHRRGGPGRLAAPSGLPAGRLPRRPGPRAPRAIADPAAGLPGHALARGPVRAVRPVTTYLLIYLLRTASLAFTLSARCCWVGGWSRRPIKTGAVSGCSGSSSCWRWCTWC